MIDVAVAGRRVRQLSWMALNPVLRFVRVLERRAQLWRHPVGRVDLGSLRRLRPISESWGFDRGLPIDRYYIEVFLRQCASDVRGRVLEVGGDEYTRRFGGAAVSTSDVLHVSAGNPRATIIAHLDNAPQLPDAAFDCVILTQTLQFIYDVPAVMRTVHRILAPGGVVLLTVPGVTHTGDPQWQSAWCWSFTELSIRKLLAAVYPPTSITTHLFGNVLTATAFLQGLAAEELTPRELDYRDARFPVLIAARAQKLGR